MSISVKSRLVVVVCTSFRALLRGKEHRRIAAFHVCQRHLQEMFAISPILQQKPTLARRVLLHTHKNHRMPSRSRRVYRHRFREADLIGFKRVFIDEKVRHECSSIFCQPIKIVVHCYFGRVRYDLTIGINSNVL